ncbi:NrtR DNA-binding winged helix domain-containing protein [Sphingobacterium sp. SG20118]|uniref:NUDIX hydrolase n=1 Tax=Sphingobacterium sp. SG20118 TaxID=3367156 RepID=UPI0037DFC1E4
MKFKLTVDCVVFAYDQINGQIKVLLIKRNNAPEKGAWALPGGFVKKNKEFIEIANEKLRSETGAQDIFMEYLNSYSLTDPSEDNRIASIAFYAIIKLEDFITDHEKSHIYHWANIKELPQLPFDHGQKVADAHILLKERSFVKPILYKLLPIRFSLNQLQELYEQIYSLNVDNRNFRRKVLNLSYIEELDEYEKNVSRRPGKLYKFNEQLFNDATKNINLF